MIVASMLNLVAALVLLVQGVDADKLLERANKGLGKARADVESAREKKSWKGLVDADVSLEETRVLLLVLQESGTPEAQKKAVDPLKAVYRLRQVLREGKAALSGAAASSVTDPDELEKLVSELTAGDPAGLARALPLLTDALIMIDRYDLAEKAVVAALEQAGRADDEPAGLRAAARCREIVEAKIRFLAMKGVRRKLAASPDDPGASDEMGQFLCLVKGDWDLGLRFLARGAETPLKTLAGRELAGTPSSLELASIGDAWYGLAEKEKNAIRKAQMQAHARQLYTVALPGLGGLARMKVEKRLDSSPSEGAPINLMRWIDLGKDVVAGTWTLQGDTLVSDASQGARVEIPYEPPAEYDVKIVFTRNDGVSDVFLALTKDRRSFEWTLGAGENRYFGFGIYKGLWAPDNGCQGSVQLANGLTNGKMHTSLVQVRKDGLKGYLDGTLVKELKQPYGDLQPHGALRLRNDSILGVGSWVSSTTFHTIELVEVNGRGRRTR